MFLSAIMRGLLWCCAIVAGKIGHDEFVLGVTDGQHRAGRGPDDLLGDAADQELRHRPRARGSP